ncbi:MAG: hypothetical protein QOF61_1282 [Acidobacteriota bacterium]|jgi:hypothetical protein|nr:hypothetical protein [Acidobacteriota bacterium]
MNDRTKAAVIGGIIAGVLSGIPFIGGCCFLWAIAGGFLAIFMYMKSVPGPMMMGDAAKLGAVTGAIGALIATVIRIPLMLLGIGMAAMGSDRSAAPAIAGLSAATGVLGIVFTIIVVVGFAVLGSIIGNAVLGKNRPGGINTPPPPPSDFGGGGYPPPPPTGGGGSYGTGS